MKPISEKLAVLALGGVLAAAGAALAATGQNSTHQDSAKAPSVGVSVDDRPLSRDSRVSYSFAPVVKKASQSVVKVFITTKAKQIPMGGLPFNDPFFRQFFGGQNGKMYTPPQKGVGSGVIVSKDGYILTNNHVVEEADELKVALQDGREFTAKVIGRDPKSDVAVIKIQADNLPRLDMADSDKTEVGDVVLAIGNPFGIGQTVTMGIVSATGRATMGLDYEDFIQTDAAINPGNSGGALIDTEGRLVGVNTAIFSQSGGNQGIGFAIPSNLARNVMEQLINNGRVTRGYLGVMIQDLTPALAKEFKLENEKGILVGDVVSGGPGDKAGLKSGDIIIQFNGKVPSDVRHLRLEAAQIRPGASVPVKIDREGSSKTLTIVVGELPDSDKASSSRNRDPQANGDALHGVAVADLDSAARESLNIPASVKGAVITDVEQGSAAAEAGLKRGDVIIEINRSPVRNAEDAVRLTERPKSRSTLLRVWSEGASRYVVVDESKG
jgi:serine protease Do